MAKPTPSLVKRPEVAVSVVPLETITTVAEVGPTRTERLAAAWLLGFGPNTRAGYGRDLRAFLGWLEERGLDALDVQRAHVVAYARQMAEVDGKAPATVARHLSALGSFYQYLVDEDVLERSPVARVRRPRVSSDSPSTGLDRGELTTLLAAAKKDGPRSHLFVLLGALNGLRVSEILGIDLEDIGTERAHRVVRITRKGGKKALVPLPPRTVEVLDEHVGERTTGPLFVTRTGARWTRSDADRTLRRLVASCLPEKAGAISPHSLRHTFVTLSLDGGADLHDVQAAAGHSDPRTTMRYHRALGNLDRAPAYLVATLV